MTMVRCEGFEKVKSLIAQDPFVVCGVVAYEIQRWQINEGRANALVGISDRIHFLN